MKFNLKFFIIIAIIAIVAYIGCWTFSHKHKHKYKNKNIHLRTESSSIKNNSLVLKGVNFYNSKTGGISWHLQASQATVNKSKNIAFLDNVTFIFKEKHIILHSLKGIYNLNDKNATAYKNVIITGDSWKIYTDNVSFFNKSNKITTNTPFKMKGKNFSLKGKQLTGFIDKKYFKIKGRVKSVWNGK